MVDLLVVAALAEEIGAFAGRLRGAGEARIEGLRCHTGRVAGWSVAVARTGDGPLRAARSLSALVAALAPARVWVIGVAGGLSPELAAGDLVAARSVRDGAEGESLQGESCTFAGVPAGIVVTHPRILTTTAAKRRLWESAGSPSPAVVDLESVAYARAARAAGRPWRVLRAVSDPASMDLPLDFEAFRDVEGGLERARIARHAALRPGLVRRLLELRTVVERCASSLAEAAERQIEIEGPPA